MPKTLIRKPHHQGPRQKPGRAVLVRCLGPGEEHSFQSRWPQGNRICTRCRQRIEQLRQMLGRTEITPTPTEGDE